MNIEIISGSTREESLSLRVAIHLKNRLQNFTRHEVGLISMSEITLPFAEKVYLTPDDAPEEIRPYAKRMFEANAFILCTPEYNGSYTPALKNLFDHFPKQLHKAFGLTTASPGVMGGVRAAQQLLHLVPGLFGIASPLMLIVPEVTEKFTIDGEIKIPAFEKQVDNFINEFLWLAEKLTANERAIV